ncbi:GntP family permease [Salicibibacter cibarius]|uniref:GntP family permease n=1 Tax=Salicibibacter cibarius TaxID=2743000 RepID=A0A7T7CAR4_9BACI|nr:GntP family permease [Salicibibacter cibarius]QQK74989.1 GntP family permease [Salicibibacter cibarius]
MLGILLGLILLMILAYRGWSIIWIAPICAGIVAITGGLDLLDAYTNTYMGGFVDFAKEWFPVFMLGAVFGKLMEYTGMAQSIATGIINVLGAKRAILGVSISCAVLAYGGISVFVVAFAVYPLALAMFKEANLPRRLMPATLAFGTLTFAMVALPGTPQIQNLIPTDYYGTTATAAPIMGLTAGAFMAITGYTYLKWREKKIIQAGETYTEPPQKKEEENTIKKTPPPFLISILPLFTVVITLNILQFDIIVALLSGIVLNLLLCIQKYRGFVTAMNEGASGSVLAIINTSAAVGFGTVVQNVPGFAQLSDIILNVPGNPLVSQAFAANVLAGATGSASGGLGIAMEALSDTYMSAAQATGIDPEAFHRIASLSSAGLDSLPHNGAILTILIVTGMSHKESYKDIAVVSVIIPILSVIPAIILASFGIY